MFSTSLCVDWESLEFVDACIYNGHYDFMSAKSAKAGDLVFQWGFLSNGCANYYKIGNGNTSTPEDSSAFIVLASGSNSGWSSGNSYGRISLITKDTVVYGGIIMRPKS